MGYGRKSWAQGEKLNPFKWLRRKPKPAPPPLDFGIDVGELPPEIRARIAAGAKPTLRQYAAERIGRKKFRSHCFVMLDGEPVGEMDVTWEDDGTHQ